MPSADFCAAIGPPHGAPSRRSDTEQISWSKFSRLPCTVAGSTLHVLDGYGLRGKWPARPTLAPCTRFLSIDPHVCSTLPSDLRPHQDRLLSSPCDPPRKAADMGDETQASALVMVTRSLWQAGGSVEPCNILARCVPRSTRSTSFTQSEPRTSLFAVSDRRWFRWSRFRIWTGRVGAVLEASSRPQRRRQRRCGVAGIERAN